MIHKGLKILKLPNMQVAVVMLLAIAMVIYNVEGLSVGRDEGVHAFAAKTLAFEGVYGLKNGTDFLAFDRRIAVGPTIIVPVAILFKLFGVSILTIRAIPGLYFILFIFCFYFLIKREFGQKVAFLTSLLILSSQWSFWREVALFNPIYRTLTGESAGLFFLTLSLLLWRKKFISIFILGLAVLTKYQFVLAIPVFLFVQSIPLKKLNIYRLITLFVVSMLPMLFWFGYQYLYLGHTQFINEIISYKNFSNQTFNFSFLRIKQNIVDKWMELNPLALKIYFTLPAIIFGWFYIIKSELRKEPLKMFLIIFPTIWMFWYIFSRGYIRYEIPGLYFSLIFLSLFFVNSFKERSLRKDTPLFVFIFSLFILIISFGFYINYRESKVVEDKNALNMANYIKDNTLSSAKILTSELDYDVDLFLDYRVLYHTESGTRALADKDIYPEIPINIEYILSKGNDLSFEKEISNSLWQQVYQEGDWYLYEKK
ncbi:MAG: glycosyltransferase family 39 protein [bacterium]